MNYLLPSHGDSLDVLQIETSVRNESYYERRELEWDK